MSCSSPFSYQATASLVITNSTMNMSGTYTLPSLTIPALAICEPAVSCHWGGAWNAELECDDGWCCCWYPPAIEIWPSIDFTASFKAPIQVQGSEQITFSSSGTIPSPAICAVVNFDTITLSLGVGVDGDNGTIELTIPPFTLQESTSGGFLIEVPFESLSTSYVSPLGTIYKLVIDAGMLFCLDPVPPQGWININLSCTLSCTILGIDYSQQFNIDCPIVSVED